MHLVDSAVDYLVAQLRKQQYRRPDWDARRREVFAMYTELVRRGIIDMEQTPLTYHAVRKYAERWGVTTRVEGSVDGDGSAWETWYAYLPGDRWAREQPRWIPGNMGMGSSMTEAVLRCLIVSDDSGLLREAVCASALVYG
jgi:hypothetical protein